MHTDMVAASDRSAVRSERHSQSVDDTGIRFRTDPARMIPRPNAGKDRQSNFRKASTAHRPNHASPCLAALPHHGQAPFVQRKPPMSAHAPVRALTDNAADTVRGILLVAFSYLILTFGDIAAKWAILASGVAWAMTWRGAFGAVTVAAFTVSTQGSRGLAQFRPVRWKTVALRSVLSSFTTIAWYLSWRHMQLAESYALGFTAPLIMTLLAVPMLGERIRWRRMLSTLVGFAGVLVMIRPGGIPLTPTVALLMAGIVGMAVTRIMTRHLSRTETPECQAFWLMISHGLAGIGMLLVMPVTAYGDASVWGALLFLGISSGLAHCVFTRAYGLAPVSALAPYEYTMLIWGGLLGFVVFGEVPSWTTLAGAAIVALAGLYNLHRERARRAMEAAIRTASPP
jgi:drug/metabolite transporter (DMT)-like permease